MDLIEFKITLYWEPLNELVQITNQIPSLIKDMKLCQIWMLRYLRFLLLLRVFFLLIFVSCSVFFPWLFILDSSWCIPLSDHVHICQELKLVVFLGTLEC